MARAEEVHIFVNLVSRLEVGRLILIFDGLAYAPFAIGGLPFGGSLEKRYGEVLVKRGYVGVGVF